MRRRQFLVLSAASIGGVLVYSLDRNISRLLAQDKSVPEQKIKIPLRFFSESEAMIVAAAASRIFPSNESGPGAREAGVVVYIDGQLAGAWGRDRRRYSHPPFDEAAPQEFGYQGAAPPRQIYRDGLKKLVGFDRISPSLQDEKLREIENTVFFNLLLQNTIEGMFCDPRHGGNVDMIGWQLIGFPGPRMSNYAEIEMYRGVEFRPKPVSLTQLVPNANPKSEDEK
jgi:gluconate 2-dehydrogenase gamma chain